MLDMKLGRIIVRSHYTAYFLCIHARGGEGDTLVYLVLFCSLLDHRENVIRLWVIKLNG